MTNPQYPADRFHAEFVKVIDESPLTTYGIGHRWAAETDEDPGVLRKRVDRWKANQPKTIRDLISLMDALGYDVRIVRRGL